MSVWIALWIIIGMSWLIDVRDRSKSWFWLVIVAFHLYWVPVEKSGKK